MSDELKTTIKSCRVSLRSILKDGVPSNLYDKLLNLDMTLAKAQNMISTELPCDDAVSRKAIIEYIKALPAVEPTRIASKIQVDIDSINNMYERKIEKILERSEEGNNMDEKNLEMWLQAISKGALGWNVDPDEIKVVEEVAYRGLEALKEVADD